MLSPEENQSTRGLLIQIIKNILMIYTLQTREKAKEESIKNQEQIPKELIEDAVVQNELNEIDALIKQKTKTCC
ncbi:hypothetical protein [Klebsiella pneumoniae]|uniref:hypothetical protein n=1 Tax=Klebsiella pneumoniae TaxID=573 RepID=UPI001BCD7F45|nr:hypothetical protein [Klebsiella pneumoniae]MBS4517624.1 hypothetical protein [Klebsiella pneumoniae]